MQAQPAAAAGAPAAPAAAGAGPQWALSEDGAYAIDLRARLAWPRCVEGMRYSGGTCVGQPLLLGRAEAAALAAARWKADGTAWRLPRVPQLQRLVDKSQQRPPGPRADLFPAAPGGWHWSSTANVAGRRGNPYNYGEIAQGRGAGAAQGGLPTGWAVNLSTGEARGDAARTSRLPVRLVRPAAGLN